MKVLGPEDGNQIIGDQIISSKPMSVIRLRSETECLAWHLRKRYPRTIPAFYEINGGLYPLTREIIEFYAKKVWEGLQYADYAVYWKMHHNQYKKYLRKNKIPLVHNRAVEPFYFDDPWSQYLAGKRVLVVHPFADTIQNQYLNREFLFENPVILPELDLMVVKSLQTSGCSEKPHANWIESLEYMIQKVKEVKFDIALLGCGCYDIPISTEIKKMGKQSIIVGGGLQILFGIMGKRWDNHEIISNLYNKHWVRPSSAETPQGFQRIEKGCYW